MNESLNWNLAWRAFINHQRQTGKGTIDIEI
jgi:hypothetical protein